MTKVICEKKDCKHYLFCPGESYQDRHQCGAEEIQLHRLAANWKWGFCFTYEKIEEGGK